MNQQFLNLANFLQRLSTTGVTVEQWQDYLVTHYADVELEAARCDAVRVSLLTPIPPDTPPSLIKFADSNVKVQIEQIADRLVWGNSATRSVVRDEWWLDWWDDETTITITWERLRVFDNQLVEVFGMDGATAYLNSYEEAASSLSEDEFTRWDHLDDDDFLEMGIEKSTARMTRPISNSPTDFRVVIIK
jgi:hypothetical protein